VDIIDWKKDGEKSSFSQDISQDCSYILNESIGGNLFNPPKADLPYEIHVDKWSSDGLRDIVLYFLEVAPDGSRRFTGKERIHLDAVG